MRLVINVNGMEESYGPVPFGEEILGRINEQMAICIGCGVKLWDLHHVDCRIEQCPRCSFRLLGACRCAWKPQRQYWQIMK